MNDIYETTRQAVCEAPLLRRSVDGLVDRYGDEYVSFSREHLTRLYVYLKENEVDYFRCVDAFLEMTFEVLRMQDRFYREGVFSNPQPDMHEDEDTMVWKYFYGLYLGAVFWANHYERIGFLQESLFPRIEPGSRILDVGMGPGINTLLLKQRLPDCRVSGNDISPYSEAIVSGMLGQLGDGPDMQLEDFYQGGFEETLIDSDVAYDVVIFSGIVEHLHDPVQGMGTVRKLFKDNGIVYFMAPTNSAFYDHRIVFSDVDEIKGFIQENGFMIESEKIIPVFKRDGKPDMLDYVSVLKKR
jgi:SAM-dependent methyltransferase